MSPGHRVRQLGQYALVVWVALTLNFALPHLAPGDPLDYLVTGEAGNQASMAPQELGRLRAEYGVEGGILDQYGRYWLGLAGGDLGTSVRFSQPVATLLAERLPWTLLLVVTGVVASTVAGVLLGVVAAWRRGGRLDVGLLTGVLAVDALPAFLVALGLVAVFSVELGWLPSFGAVAGTGAGSLLEAGRRLVLPGASMALATLGPAFLLTRGSMLAALDSGFVHMAEAKGASPRRVLFAHALRNSLLPVTTNLGLRLGSAVSGVVVIETVFAYPGLGRLVYDAVLARDYPLLQGAFVLTTLAVIAANLAVDLAYPLLDPRARKPAPGGSR